MLINKCWSLLKAATEPLLYWFIMWYMYICFNSIQCSILFIICTSILYCIVNLIAHLSYQYLVPKCFTELLTILSGKWSWRQLFIQSIFTCTECIPLIICWLLSQNRGLMSYLMSFQICTTFDMGQKWPLANYYLRQIGPGKIPISSWRAYQNSHGWWRDSDVWYLWTFESTPKWRYAVVVLSTSYVHCLFMNKGHIIFYVSWSKAREW